MTSLVAPIPRLRAVGVLILALLIGPCLTSTSVAAPAPKPGSLSDVQVTAGRITAVLTVPATKDTVSIDHGSIRATVGGKSAPVVVESVQREQRSAVLLIDTSGSMGTDGIAAASAAAQTFLRESPSDLKVGLAAFSDTPTVLVAPTTDRQPVLKALTTLKAHGETALYDALGQTAQALGSQGSRTIIVLSDGGDTVSTASRQSVVKLLSGGGIRVEAVAFRTGESQLATLQTLATGAQGRVVQAGDRAALKAAFASAAMALSGQVRVQIAVPAGASGDQDLRVSGTANGVPILAEVTARVPVTTPSTTTATATAPAVVAPAPAPQMAGAPGLSSGWVWGAAGAVFVGLLGLALFLAAPLFTPAGRRRIQSLDQYIGTAVGATVRSTAQSGTRGITARILRVSDRWAKRHESSADTALLLERADLPLRVNEWYVLRCAAVVVAFAATWLMWHGSVAGDVVAVLVSVALGLGAPMLFLRFKASKRARKFETQLPDVLTLIASSLATGFSLAQAVDAITRDAAEPSAKEFSRALAETRIGAALEDSLERLATRMDSTNLEWATMAIRIQRQVGGNLAETLRTTATTLREREALHRQVRALSAEGRLSAYILIALPIGLFGYLLLVNREYVSLLWTRGIGLLMLAAGAVAMVIGIFWMRKVVEVEV